jgi:hypothetical protein
VVMHVIEYNLRTCGGPVSVLVGVAALPSVSRSGTQDVPMPPC